MSQVGSTEKCQNHKRNFPNIWDSRTPLSSWINRHVVVLNSSYCMFVQANLARWPRRGWLGWFWSAGCCQDVAPNFTTTHDIGVVQDHWTPRMEGLSLSDHIISYPIPKMIKSVCCCRIFPAWPHEKWPQGRWCRNGAPQEAPWHPPSPGHNCPHHVHPRSRMHNTKVQSKLLLAQLSCNFFSVTMPVLTVGCGVQRVECRVWSAECWA